MTIDDAFKMVKNAIVSGRTANGYVIIAPPRDLGMEMALRILQTLFCQQEQRPCGICTACQHVLERAIVDIHWIFPEKKSRIISAEQIRDNLLYAISQTSFTGGWKAGVLVGADRLGEAAANIFLKTLEEPPPKTLFLLLTDKPRQMLPTIISRCQHINLNAKQDLDGTWKAQILAILSSPEWRTPCEKIAQANRLYAILSEIKQEAQKIVIAEDQASEVEVLEEEDKDVFDARVSARHRELRQDFLLLVVQWFRDLLITKSGAATTLLHYPEYSTLFQDRSQNLSLSDLFANLELIEKLAQQLERSIPEEALLTNTFNTLKHGVA